MLTKVYLDGAMGRKFGKKWELDIASPAEAIRMIDANMPGFSMWIRDNLKKYGAYRVVCRYRDGSKRELESEEFSMQGELESVRFVPLAQGSGAAGRIVLGVVLLVASIWFAPRAGPGLALITGGIVELLSPQPKTHETKTFDSHYFDGPQSTTRQGGPVKLVYGTVRVGGQAVSLTMDIDQQMN